MKNKVSTKQLVMTGLMIAITVVMSYQNIYLYPPKSGRITLRFIPMIYASIILGPKLGMMVGGISDPLIYFLTLGSPGLYFPGFMITNMIMGFYPGLIMRDWKDNYVAIKLAIISILSFIITIFLDSYWLSIIINKGFWYFVTVRLIPNIVQLVIVFVALYVLVTRIKLKESFRRK